MTLNKAELLETLKEEGFQVGIGGVEIKDEIIYLQTYDDEEECYKITLTIEPITIDEYEAVEHSL